MVRELKGENWKRAFKAQENEGEKENAQYELGSVLTKLEEDL